MASLVSGKVTAEKLNSTKSQNICTKKSGTTVKLHSCLGLLPGTTPLPLLNTDTTRFTYNEKIINFRNHKYTTSLYVSKNFRLLR